MPHHKRKKRAAKPDAGFCPQPSCPADLNPCPFDELRQRMFPPEFRIDRPLVVFPTAQPIADPGDLRPGMDCQPPHGIDTATEQALAEVATCLWYLKTKHFRRDWNDQHCDDDDPRVRRALGRVNKGIDALQHGGVVIEDPTDKRYPTGGEAMMRPLQFTPTEGLTCERVTEAVVPCVFLGDRLLQRAEVFVAVPLLKTSVPDAASSGGGTPCESGRPGQDEPTVQRLAEEGSSSSVMQDTAKLEAEAPPLCKDGEQFQESGCEIKPEDPAKEGA